MNELDEAIGKLSAAALQSSPTDDQIITDHVRDSVALLLKFRHKTRERGGQEMARLKDRIDARLNNVLCEMKEGCDDSIVGFNAAWDIVRATFAELPLETQ